MCSFGLKQAPRAWFERFNSVVCAAGFSPSDHDPALFTHTSEHGRTLLLLYVDDMLITGDDLEYITFVKQRLSEQFMMSDLGPLSYFLGIEVTSAADDYYLSQHRYIEDLISRSGLIDTRVAATPMELHVHLRSSDGVLLDDPSRYHHIVGSLVYLTITRPDIAHVCSCTQPVRQCSHISPLQPLASCAALFEGHCFSVLVLCSFKSTQASCLL